MLQVISLITFDRFLAEGIRKLSPISVALRTVLPSKHNVQISIDGFQYSF